MKKLKLEYNIKSKMCVFEMYMKIKTTIMESGIQRCKLNRFVCIEKKFYFLDINSVITFFDLSKNDNKTWIQAFVSTHLVEFL